MLHTQIIIYILIASGLLGGLTNFFLLYNIDYKTKECLINLFKSILLSLCASMTVQLFLQIISNNLLDVPQKDSFKEKNYFILAGFCVLAAFYSKRFLDDLYSKVNRVEKKAEEAKQIAENVEQKNQEIDNVDDIVNETAIHRALTANYTKDDLRAVSTAILTSKYSYRTVTGISKDTNISDDKVRGILEILKNRGYAESKTNKKGNDIWKIIIKD